MSWGFSLLSGGQVTPNLIALGASVLLSIVA